jgi:GNAT superfamily N-acetyltransferase
MQAAAQRIWSPTSRWHIGDLAWGRFMHAGREGEWPTALWTDESGSVLAWGWVGLPAHLDLLVDPAHPELAEEVLGWFHQVATTADDYTVTILDTENHLVDALVAMGYRLQSEGPFFNYCWMSLVDALPAPEIPEGFTLRHVRESDVERRVQAHQLAFNPSRVSIESYHNLMAAWPYSADLDWIVEAPNGDFAAFALAWFDEINRVGELEPVGTVPAYRGVGLARAVSLAALHALKHAGADSAVVYPRGDAGHPVPARLYGGMGFVPQARTVTYAHKKFLEDQS